MKLSFPRALSGALIVLAVLVALLLIGLSFLPFPVAELIVDSAVADGEIDLFTPSFYHPIMMQVRLVGFALVFLTVVAFVIRRRIERGVRNLIVSFDEFRSTLKQGTRRIVDEDGVRLVWLGSITVIGAIMRLMYLSQPMRSDESQNFIEVSKLPVYILVTSYRNMQNHPVNTLLSHISYTVFGNNPWAIRLPMFLAGVIIIPAMYLLARKLYGSAAGLLAAAVVAASHPFILYSTSARGYAALILTFVIVLRLAIYLKDADSVAGWLTFAILSAVGFYAIPQFVYSLTVIGTWLLMSALVGDTAIGRATLVRRTVVWSVVAIAITAVLYLPMLIVSGIEPFGEHTIPEKRVNELRELVRYTGLLWEHWNTAVPLAVTLILVIGFIVSLAFHRWVACGHRMPVAVAAVIGLAMFVIIHSKAPYPFQRVWLFLFTVYASMAAGGIAWLVGVATTRFGRVRRWAPIGLALVIALWSSTTLVATDSMAHSWEGGVFPDAKEVAEFLGDYLRPGDQVVYTSPSMPLVYYMDRLGMDPEYMRWYEGRVDEVNSSDRLILVLNTFDQQAEGAGFIPIQTIPWLVQEWSIRTDLYMDPVFIKEFPTAEVYVMEHRESGPTPSGLFDSHPRSRQGRHR